MAGRMTHAAFVAPSIAPCSFYPLGAWASSLHDGHRLRSTSGTRAFNFVASCRIICRAAFVTRSTTCPTLSGRILNAALELEHQHLVSVELLEQRLELASVEAASKRLVRVHGPEVLTPPPPHSSIDYGELVSEPGLEPLQGVPEQDEDPGVRRRLAQQRRRPEVVHVGRRPLSAQGSFGSRKEPVVGIRVFTGEFPLEVAVKEVSLLSRGALDSRMVTQQPIPPGGPCALRTHSYEVRWTDDPIARPGRWPPLRPAPAPGAQAAHRRAADRSQHALNALPHRQL